MPVHDVGIIVLVIYDLGAINMTRVIARVLFKNKRSFLTVIVFSHWIVQL